MQDAGTRGHRYSLAGECCVPSSSAAAACARSLVQHSCVRIIIIIVISVMTICLGATAFVRAAAACIHAHVHYFDERVGCYLDWSHTKICLNSHTLRWC